MTTFMESENWKARVRKECEAQKKFETYWNERKRRTAEIQAALQQRFEQEFTHHMATTAKEDDARSKDGGTTAFRRPSTSNCSAAIRSRVGEETNSASSASKQAALVGMTKEDLVHALKEEKRRNKELEKYITHLQHTTDE